MSPAEVVVVIGRQLMLQGPSVRQWRSRLTMSFTILDLGEMLYGRPGKGCSPMHHCISYSLDDLQRLAQLIR